MNNLFLETQGTNTYVEYRIGADDELDTMSLGMLTNNNIPGLATASFAQMDLDRFIKYNVSAKVSVKQLFSGPVNKKRLLGVFSGIIDAMLAVEDYMLDPNSLILDLDYIFSDVSTCETVMICLPLIKTEVTPPDLGLFFKNIVFTTQFDQTENCDHVAQILNYLNSNPVLSLVDFKQLLEKIASSNDVSKKEVAKSGTAQGTNSGKTVIGSQPVVPSGNVGTVSSSPNREAVAHTPKTEAVPVVTNTGSNKTKPVQENEAEVPEVVMPEGQKPMSWLYLMQHYNKENAAIYKAQQDAKKGKKAKPVAQAKPQTTQSKSAIATQAGVGYAVPGAVTSYAVPNQPQSEKPVQPVVPKTDNTSVQTVKSEPAVAVQQQVQTSKPANFGETTVLGGAIGETTVLGATMEPAKADPHLIRSKNNEKIPLNKPVFRIGKERSYVDYFISDNTAISRGHANVVNHNGEFFIVDTNSTNHTYVNGAMIQSGVETKLAHGDKVRLANEDFEFRLY